MTKIQIDDGRSAKKEVSSASSKKAVRKIAITEAPKEEKKVEKKVEKKIEIVEKKAEVAEKKVEKKIKHQASHPVNSTATHSILQKSTTLSRRYVKKPASATPVKEEKKAEPAKAEKKPKVEIKTRITKKRTDRLAEKRLKAEREQVARAAKLAQVKATREAKLAQARAEKEAKLARKQTALKARTEAATARKAAKIAKKVPKEDRALRSATAVITRMNTAEKTEKPAKPEMKRAFKKKSKAGRIFLALICSGATMVALVAFVHFSIPDLSVRVAAIQTGIEATYPTFVPRNYNLSSVTSDKDGIVMMHFDGPEGASFTLSEEKSTWDSTALLNNYVKKVYPSDFTALREQGITIYVRGEKASWVNGGLLYKIESSGKYLTKEQIRNIATSL
ncbi:hypothetical protein IJU22_01350 [Candidatus Saccharibacteria bacterium]|nr:hypothetical protein [Candidatus Saccharibacteria bacterium]